MNRVHFLKISTKLKNYQPRKTEKIQINKTKNERRAIIMDNTEIHRIARNYCEQLYANQWANLEEMGKLLNTYNL